MRTSPVCIPTDFTIPPRHRRPPLPCRLHPPVILVHLPDSPSSSVSIYIHIYNILKYLGPKPRRTRTKSLSFSSFDFLILKKEESNWKKKKKIALVDCCESERKIFGSVFSGTKQMVSFFTFLLWIFET